MILNNNGMNVIFYILRIYTYNTFNLKLVNRIYIIMSYCIFITIIVYNVYGLQSILMSDIAHHKS